MKNDAIFQEITAIKRLVSLIHKAFEARQNGGSSFYTISTVS